MKEIVDLLFAKQDKQFRSFQASLIPNIDKSLIIGIKTPELKKIAKEIASTSLGQSFIKELPHHYFEENQLHAFIISNIKDYQSCLNEINRFLPYIDNWATCDQSCPKSFIKHKDVLINEIKKWLNNEHIYTKRFAIKMLMSLYLDDSFKEEYLALVSKIKSEIMAQKGVQGVYDIILNGYGPNLTIGSLHIAVPDTMTAHQIHGLTRQIAEMMYDNHGIVMTVGVYANASGNSANAELQRIVVETLSREEHILEVHGFYCYEDGRISVDVVPDYSITDDRAYLQHLYEQLSVAVPDHPLSIVIDHLYSE